jgi:hypothetical protein
MPAKWSNKFELKPGRWVFVPTSDARRAGLEIKKIVESKWAAPEYFYHLRSGGHVAAVQSHAGNSCFFKVDIQNFFASIGRTRVTRCLKPILGYKSAREYAIASTVPHPGDGGMCLPYGFIQSQILASVCLHDSAIGRLLHQVFLGKEATVSVYVDDIIVSSSDLKALGEIYTKLEYASKRARLTLSQEKGSAPAKQVSAFNILLSQAAIEIEPARMQKFSAELAAGGGAAKRRGIINYVKSVCPAQLENL